MVTLPTGNILTGLLLQQLNVILHSYRQHALLSLCNLRHSLPVDDTSPPLYLRSSGSKSFLTVVVTYSSEFNFAVRLSSLNIVKDSPSSHSATRRIKQISVTLPVIIGLYENVQAALSGSLSLNDFSLPRGCSAMVVFHGNRDSGLFQPHFIDSCYLPFKSIPLNHAVSLALRFPDAAGTQKCLLHAKRSHSWHQLRHCRLTV
ncbi:TPA: hypothetical protein MB363_003596 [Klebsiella quasipneumoniae subsp. similipneumoniae]|nr:hypothetical protein [Klebsiella quasipneumoniae subsp. similipneumoniae]